MKIRVTMSGRHATVSDGSQVLFGIVVANIDATLSDVEGPVYVEGEFLWQSMIVDASWSLRSLQIALQRSGSGLYVRSQGVLG